jgi:hypothetical protein
VAVAAAVVVAAAAAAVVVAAVVVESAIMNVNDYYVVRCSVLRLFLAEGWPAVELLFLLLVPVFVYIHERSKKIPASH